MKITPSNQDFGAQIDEVDLSQPLSGEQAKAIREAWLKYHVISFPKQRLSDDDLERIPSYFGRLGNDPFIQPVKGRKHVLAIARTADETSPIFAEGWHTDWSFKAEPPIGTCLYGITIPPHGGDTLFADQHRALSTMPEDLRNKIEGLNAIHSAAVAYAPDGLYGEDDAANNRTMKIVADDSAYQTFTHPLISPHPETGELRLFGCLGYIIGIQGMDQAESLTLLSELHAWQTQEQFIYQHKWQAGTLVMWDNRSVLHRATGGFEGYARLLHRTTIEAT